MTATVAKENAAELIKSLFTGDLDETYRGSLPAQEAMRKLLKTPDRTTQLSWALLLSPNISCAPNKVLR